jgi:hypothetical protein
MIELVVTHDGKDWIAKQDALSAKAPTLEELDNEVKRLLKEKGYLGKGEKLDIFMVFDNSTIPLWMRQYGQHYFNRMVRLEG